MFEPRLRGEVSDIAIVRVWSKPGTDSAQFAKHGLVYKRNIYATRTKHQMIGTCVDDQRLGV